MSTAALAEPGPAAASTGARPGAAPRRVLYFNAWSSAHGGSSTSLLDIVANLDRSRYEPVVMCSQTGELTERLGELHVPFVVRTSNRLTREEIWRFVPQVPAFARWLRREGIALVHGNTGASRRSLVVAARVAGIPYVQHVRNPVRGADRNLAFRLATRIIANSHHTASSLLSDARFAGKTVTVHNAVDLARYRAADDRRAEFDAGARPVVGFVGHLVPNKGALTLIDAMPAVLQACPDALLLVVGCAPQGEEAYEAACRARVRELGIDRHVRFTGFRRDVPALMRTFDVFVLPTRTETFGKVVVEAMAAGRPVVVSNVGGIPEIVSDPALGTLMPPDDPSAAAEAILRYLRDPGLRARVGASARQHVWAHFSLEAMLARLQQVYDDVLAGAAAGA